MAGYIGSKAVNLSTTGADINGNANVDGTLDVTGTVTSDGLTVDGIIGTINGTDIDMDGTASGQLKLDGNGYAGAIALNAQGMNIYHNSSSRDIIFGTNETERLRIDGSGNLVISGGGDIKTTTITGSTNTIQEGPRLSGGANDGNGYRIGGVGVIRTAGTGGGTTSGVGVGIYVSSNTYSGYDQTYNNTLAYVFRQTAFHGAVDNKNDLGLGYLRWDDVYATNGTIQTSDRNEKEAIASLTPTEMLVAARLSSSFKNFKWKDSVAEKGAAARLHSGIIAQDVQDAFTVEGLDAGDYSMFISGTWWEHEGTTYETLEEAPEGATERTRLGVRYPELLAFVAAYSDQRFISIETRLAALEAT